VRSDTGGLTFNGPRQVHDSGTSGCGGLHGHLRVASDGTAYLPNKGCNGHQAVAVSTDGGDSWQVREVAVSTKGRSDPSVSADRQNKIDFGFVGGDGHPPDRYLDRPWPDLHDPRRRRGSIRHPECSVPRSHRGQRRRATFGFLGATTPGDFQDAGFGKSGDGATYTGGEWHLYLATTYDGGQSWTTVDATPKDPVQRGSICLEGVGCSGNDRNLLDFDAECDQALRGPRRRQVCIHRHRRNCARTCRMGPQIPSGSCCDPRDAARALEAVRNASSGSLKELFSG
jgi:hypothetical protein